MSGSRITKSWNLDTDTWNLLLHTSCCQKKPAKGLNQANLNCEHLTPKQDGGVIHEINQIEDKDFRIGFEILTETKSAHEFTRIELTEILLNYFAIVLLKKTYWRLKYSIRDCKVIELDFIFKGLTKLPEALKYLTSLKF